MGFFKKLLEALGLGRQKVAKNTYRVCKLAF